MVRIPALLFVRDLPSHLRCLKTWKQETKAGANDMNSETKKECKIAEGERVKGCQG